MTKGKSPEGRKIGKMEVNLQDETKGDILSKKIEVEVEGEKRVFEVPSHPIDSIDLFGLPPYEDRSIGLDAVNNSLSRSYDSKDFSETYRLDLNIPEEIKIEILRKSDNISEKRSIRDVNLPNIPKINSVDIDHSAGKFRALTEKRTALGRDKIRKVKRNHLDDDEEDYFDKVFREETLPDVLILKESRMNGKVPPFTQKRFPFWEYRKHENDKVRILELGYLEYGDNEREIDKSHGRWYKFLKLENFDIRKLEVQERNWKSQKIEIEGEKREVLKSYEKYLYEC